MPQFQKINCARTCAGLWKAAALTAHDLRARLAIVHMVHEARGVDVTPSTINKFRMAKDTETVEVHAPEIGI